MYRNFYLQQKFAVLFLYFHINRPAVAVLQHSCVRNFLFVCLFVKCFIYEIEFQFIVMLIFVVCLFNPSNVCINERKFHVSLHSSISMFCPFMERSCSTQKYLIRFSIKSNYSRLPLIE